MTRGVRLYLVGSLVLLGLAGCGRGWLQEREPWRRQAEAACIKSGAVKSSPYIVSLRSIDGPGVCGADYPFKVASLGEGSAALGYSEAPRPPGLIPRAAPVYAPPEPPLAQPPYMPVQRGPTAPMPIERGPSAPMPLDPALHASPGESTYEPQQDYRSSPPYRSQRGPSSSPLRHEPAPQRDPYRMSAPDGRPRDLPAAPGRQEDPDEWDDDESPSEAPLPRLGPTAWATFITPAATLACPMVSALDHWIASALQPAALRWFGQPVAEIKQIASFGCRSRNNQYGARISEHAFGNALDISGFTLADGRKVLVESGWRGGADEQGFLRDVYAAACAQFSTVLGPGSNSFHYNHIHLDLARHAHRRSVCNPKPVSGFGMVSKRDDAIITGSTGTRDSEDSSSDGMPGAD